MWNDGGYMDNDAGPAAAGPGNASRGGAGFMNSPSQFASPATEKKDRRSQNIVPITVKSIQDFEGDTLMINGVEAHIVVIVGIIRSVEVSSTKITYMIDDTTGVISGIQWLESDIDDESKQPQLMELTYCKVVGSIRTQMGKKHLLIYRITPITDLNRITTHILEVIHTPIKLQDLNTKRESGIQANMSLNQTTPSVQEEQMDHQSEDQENQPPGAVRPAPSSMQGLTGAARMMYTAMLARKNEMGFTKQEIYNMLDGKLSIPLISKLADDLSAEGHLFTTFDEEHFSTVE